MCPALGYAGFGCLTNLLWTALGFLLGLEWYD